MPDDEKVEVTEQGGGAGSEDEGFSGGFSEEPKGTAESDAEPEKGEAKEEAKESEETTEEEEKPEDEDKEPEKKAESKEEQGDEDEDVVRGKELLEMEKKAEEDATKLREKIEAQKAETQAKEGAKPAPPPPFTEDLAKIFVDLANVANLPQTIKIGDTELELKDFVEANPEFTVLAGMEATNIIQRLVDQGILMTSDAHNQAISKVLETVDLRLFDMAVRQYVDNPEKIWDSKEFQEYHKGAPDTFKALFRSKDPMDHVRGFNKFLGKATEKARTKVRQVDNEAARKKKVHEDIHSHTMRSGKSRPSTETFADTDEEFSAGFRGNQ